MTRKKGIPMNNQKKNPPLDFRYYDMPQDDPVIIFTGDSWKREYGKEYPDQLHFHNIIEIGVCHAGTGKMRYMKEEKSFGPDMISIIPRNVPHNTLSDPDTVSFWEYIFVDEEVYLNRIFRNNRLMRDKALTSINTRYILTENSRQPEMAGTILQILGESQGKKPYAHELIHAGICSLLLLIARASESLEAADPGGNQGSIDQSIMASIQYIDVHYADDITIGDLAGQANISESHFRRLFTAYMNMTPVDYINMIRIRKTCTLLVQTNDSVERVAEMVGYTTPSTFNRNFRKLTGASPYQWKKQNRTNPDMDMELKVTAHRGWV